MNLKKKIMVTNLVCSVFAAIACMGVLSSPAQATSITLDFEDLVPMPNRHHTNVPELSRLYDQYLIPHGVLFTSGSDFVSAILLGTNHATSGVVGIGGSTPEGTMTYERTSPIVATFFNPTMPSVQATTDFVSVRADLIGEYGLITLNAFGTDGNLIGTRTVVDINGVTLSISVPGIHSVQFLGTSDDRRGGVGLDDFTFNSVTPLSEPVPEPASMTLLGLGLVGIATRRFRKK